MRFYLLAIERIHLKLKYIERKTEFRMLHLQASLIVTITI